MSSFSNSILSLPAIHVPLKVGWVFFTFLVLNPVHLIFILLFILILISCHFLVNIYLYSCPPLLCLYSSFNFPCCLYTVCLPQVVLPLQVTSARTEVVRELVFNFTSFC